MSELLQKLILHQSNLKRCSQCPDMQGPAVHGEAILSPVILIGQAPGAKEIIAEKPFAWTAGKTLFGWFDAIGVSEACFRHHVYMTAVCRCFPGKKERGGDRVPGADEIKNCSRWLSDEIQIIKPELILLVGKLAINQVIPVKKLTDIVGKTVTTEIFAHPCDVIALPHPSGASTWHRSEPGKSLLFQALELVKQHPAWENMLLSK